MEWPGHSTARARLCVHDACPPASVLACYSVALQAQLTLPCRLLCQSSAVMQGWHAQHISRVCRLRRADGHDDSRALTASCHPGVLHARLRLRGLVLQAHQGGRARAQQVPHSAEAAARASPAARQPGDGECVPRQASSLLAPACQAVLLLSGAASTPVRRTNVCGKHATQPHAGRLRTRWCSPAVHHTVDRQPH